MRASMPGRNNQNNRIVLGLVEALERESAQSQRQLAGELGIALGLANIYLKRDVSKGLLEMAQAPARRYAYYLTPHGFAEKARLTFEHMSYRSNSSGGPERTVHRCLKWRVREDSA